MSEAFQDNRDSTGWDLSLVQAYMKIGVPVDMLAYTKQFDELYEQVIQGETTCPTKAAVFRRLLKLRKSGRLPRLRQSRAVEEHQGTERRAG